MSDSRVAQDPNRLPWLPEERKPRRKGEWAALLLGALLSALIVAGVSFWLGAKNATEADDRARPAAASPPRATVPLPQPMVEQPRAEQVRPAPVPIVQPVPEPTVRIAAPEPVRKARPAATQGASAKSKASTAAEKTPAAEAAESKPVVARPAPLRVWPATVSEGANGRVVRIGAFSTRHNAKKGWWQVIRRYPGMRRLKAVVTPVPAPRTGKTYYRLQFGTTSQAHSEVLCQRMRAIRKTCAVVGLPPRPSAPQARGGGRR